MVLFSALLEMKRKRAAVVPPATKEIRKNDKEISRPLGEILWGVEDNGRKVKKHDIHLYNKWK